MIRIFLCLTAGSIILGGCISVHETKRSDEGKPAVLSTLQSNDVYQQNSYRNCQVTHYHYDASSGKGTISVDISGKGIEVRQWIVENIGKICSDKNITLEAGKETGEGGHYRILSEFVKDGILTIEFESAW